MYKCVSLFARAGVRVYVSMYVSTYVRMNVYVYVCVYVSMYVCIHTSYDVTITSSFVVGTDAAVSVSNDCHGKGGHKLTSWYNALLCHFRIMPHFGKLHLTALPRHTLIKICNPSVSTHTVAFTYSHRACQGSGGGAGVKALELKEGAKARVINDTMSVYYEI